MQNQTVVSYRDFNPRAYVRHDCPVPGIPSPWGYFNPRAYVRHDQLWRV